MNAELPMNLPAPPRQVVRKDAGCLLAVAYLIIAFFGVIFLTVIAYFAVTLAFVLLGHPTTGETTEFSDSSKSHIVSFQYTTPAGTFEDYERTSRELLKAQEQKHDAGDHAVRVLYLHLGPLHFAGVPELASPWWVPARALLFVGLSAGLFLVLYWAGFVFPRHDKMLLQFGTATAGVVTGKTTRRTSRTVGYYVQYVYEGPSGKRWTVETSLRGKRKWNSIEIGEVVTVLFDPKDERRSSVYEFGLYKIKE